MALDNVDFAIARGEIRAIIGPANSPCTARPADPTGAIAVPAVSGLPGPGCVALAAATVDRFLCEEPPDRAIVRGRCLLAWGGAGKDQWQDEEYGEAHVRTRDFEVNL